MTKSELKEIIKEVISEMSSTNEGYATEKGKQSAKERIAKLKAEYDRYLKLRSKKDYLDTNDPQARNFYARRLKEIPKEISKIRQKILDI